MADAEVDTAVQALAEKHVKLMDDIFRTGLEKSQQLCDESLSTIRKHTGLRSAMLDKALERITQQT